MDFGFEGYRADDEKISPELKVATSVSENELLNSAELSSGYVEQLKEWEVIIKYNGNFDVIKDNYKVSGVDVGFGYGIITVDERKIERLSNDPRIIYIDKPKDFYFEAYDIKSLAVSDMYQNANEYGVMVGIIDSGIDYYNSDFYTVDASGYKHTLVYELYDQQTERVMTYEDINRDINSGRYRNMDNRGHGTAVASIITDGLRDIKYKLVVVRLLNSNSSASPNTSAFLKALKYVSDRAREEQLPLVINLSYGNNYGDHSGGSILEEYIDSLSSSMRVNIVTGMGNAANMRRHAQFVLGNKSREMVELTIGDFQPSLSVQVWRRLIDIVDIAIVSPDNIEYGPLNRFTDVNEFLLPDISIYAVDGISTFSPYRETYISFIPKSEYIYPGVWKIVFIPKSIQSGRVDLWLPSSDTINLDTGFLKPAINTTLTVPASSNSVISVAAYNQRTLNYAVFSGRGYTTDGRVKPDIAAPGVDILVSLPGNQKSFASGTSFAAPFVSVQAVRLMQWGIVEGNDRYMYGETLKARLIEDSIRLPGFETYPNEKIGWGVLNDTI